MWHCANRGGELQAIAVIWKRSSIENVPTTRGHTVERKPAAKRCKLLDAARL